MYNDTIESDNVFYSNTELSWISMKHELDDSSITLRIDSLLTDLRKL